MRVSREAKLALEERFGRDLLPCLANPFLDPEELRKIQLRRVRHLVDRAFAELPFYRDKYGAVGFRPGDVRSWDDFARLPAVTKRELVEAFPERCVNRNYRWDGLFSTRSSGSSGQTLLIKVDLDAVIVDTLQGVRQFWLQSRGAYRDGQLVVHLYTVPWWFPSVGDHYRSAFVSSLVPTPKVAGILADLQPHVLSCYPTNLAALLPFARKFSHRLSLAVVHSEQSTRRQREEWSEQLGVPVLDEYSSEEATRIALELPCGHYHVCEDTVVLEVVQPDSLGPQRPGQPGLAVVTNLLNEAMPFIRYVQGDLVRTDESVCSCSVRWARIGGVDGRSNDSFVSRLGRAVPAGTVLDVTYRWMFDAGVTLREFELVQEGEDRVRAVFVPADGTPEPKLRASVAHLEDLLGACLEHPVHVTAQLVSSLPSSPGKRRPIRRTFASRAHAAA